MRIVFFKISCNISNDILLTMRFLSFYRVLSIITHNVDINNFNTTSQCPRTFHGYFSINAVFVLTMNSVDLLSRMNSKNKSSDHGWIRKNLLRLSSFITRADSYMYSRRDVSLPVTVSMIPYKFLNSIVAYS